MMQVCSAPPPSRGNPTGLNRHLQGTREPSPPAPVRGHLCLASPAACPFCSHCHMGGERKGASPGFMFSGAGEAEEALLHWDISSRYDSSSILTPSQPWLLLLLNLSCGVCAWLPYCSFFALPYCVKAKG